MNETNEKIQTTAALYKNEGTYSSEGSLAFEWPAMAINRAACVSNLRWWEVQKNWIRPTNKDCEAYTTELRNILFAEKLLFAKLRWKI